MNEFPIILKNDNGESKKKSKHNLNFFSQLSLNKKNTENINSFLKQMIVFCILLTFVNFTNAYKCGHDKIHKTRNLNEKNKNLFHYEPKKSKDDRFLQNEEEFSTIRIHLDYYNIENYDGVSSTWKTNVIKIVDSAIDMFTSIIKTRRLTSTLKIGDCDVGIDYTIQDSVKQGIDTDLILIVIIDDTDESENVEGWATMCYKENNTFRPVSGIVGISKSTITFDKENWLEYYTYLIFHEVIHVLGFNESVYDQFYDADTETAKPLSDIVISSEVNGIQRNFIRSTKVLAAAKKHFGCDSIVGVELENQGGSGSAGSHWESRVMLGDVMIAVSYEELFLSEITCAFLEDTGWYEVSCYSGGLFKFGEGLGCDFLTETCINNKETRFQNQFCDENGKYLCMVGDKSKGVCLVKTITGSYATEIKSNSDYQYFGDSTTGGFYFADYCPVVNSISSSSYYFNGNCSLGQSGLLPDEIQEGISSDSGCFMSSLINNDVNTNNLSLSYDLPTCYKYICNYSETTITVIISNKKFTCPGNAITVEVDGFSGSFNCPSFNDYCSGTVSCNSIEDCINKKSLRTDNVVLKNSSSSTKLSLVDATGTETTTSNTPSTSSTPSTPSTTTTTTGGFYTKPFSLIAFISFLLLLINF